MTTTATPATIRPTALRRIVGAMVSLVAAAALALGLASPANAYVNTSWSGRQGSIQFASSTGRSVVALSGYRFSTPTLIVYRNGAINGSYQQELEVQTSLQRWNGSGWTQTDGYTQQVLINMGTYSAAAVGGSVLVSGIRSPGYFRVVTTVRWGSASAYPYWTGAITGTQQFVPSASSDMICAVSTCQNRMVTNGSLYVWG